MEFHSSEDCRHKKNTVYVLRFCLDIFDWYSRWSFNYVAQRAEESTNREKSETLSDSPTLKFHDCLNDNKRKQLVPRRSFIRTVRPKNSNVSREREREKSNGMKCGSSGFGTKRASSDFRFRHFRPAVKVISVFPPDRPTYCHRLHNLPCYLLAKLIYYSTIISARPIDYRRWNEDVLCTLPPAFRNTRAPRPTDYVKEHVTINIMRVTREWMPGRVSQIERECGVSDSRRDCKRGCAWQPISNYFHGQLMHDQTGSRCSALRYT